MLHLAVDEVANARSNVALFAGTALRPSNVGCDDTVAGIVCVQPFRSTRLHGVTCVIVFHVARSCCDAVSCSRSVRSARASVLKCTALRHLSLEFFAKWSLPHTVTATYSYCHIQLLPHTVTAAQSYCHISYCRTVTATYSYCHIQLLPQKVTATYSYSHTQSLPHTVTATYSYCHKKLLPHTVTFSCIPPFHHFLSMPLCLLSITLFIESLFIFSFSVLFVFHLFNMKFFSSLKHYLLYLFFLLVYHQFTPNMSPVCFTHS